VLYRVGFRSAHLLKMSLVSSTAMLAMCLLTISWDKPAGATLPGENVRIAFSKLQEFPGEDFEIYTVLQNGTDLRQLTDKSGRDDLPTWSPDGTKVGWVHGKEFWVHDIETGRQRMVSSIEGVSSAVVWSPSGSKLAFSRQTPPPEGKSDIFVMDADGANQTNITDTRSDDELEVDWSPDGSKLAYTKIDWSPPRERGPDIYVTNSDGTNRVNLTNSMPDGVAHPSWSPDGSKIAFDSCPREGTAAACGIYVMNADGSNPVNITRDTPLNLSGAPVWSPDGSKMAFLACLGGSGQNCNIFVMNADGSNPVNIMRDTPLNLSGAPVWSPDGSKMAFLACLGGSGQNCNIFVMNADGSNAVNITNMKGYYGFGGTGSGGTLDWQPLAGPTRAKPEKQQEQRQQNQQQQQGSKSRSITVHQPDTGGPSLLLVASALLFSGGVMFYAGVKHRI
jgi:Tol biopolymer transport system component